MSINTAIYENIPKSISTAIYENMPMSISTAIYENIPMSISTAIYENMHMSISRFVPAPCEREIWTYVYRRRMLTCVCKGGVLHTTQGGNTKQESTTGVGVVIIYFMLFVQAQSKERTGARAESEQKR